MYTRLAALAFALFLTAAACDTATQAPPALGPLAFQTLEHSSEMLVGGQYGSYDFKTPRNLVIRNEADFRAFWRALHDNDPSPPPLPNIDFSQETVMAALLGTKPSGGYIIEIEEIIPNADAPARVRIEVTVPGGSCGVTGALTSPYHVIKVEGTGLNFTFADERVRRTCAG